MKVFLSLVCAAFISASAQTKAPESSTVIRSTYTIDETSPAEPLSIKDALDRAMRNNPDILVDRYDVDYENLNYQNAWDTMYLPSIGFSLSTTTAKTIGKLPGATYDNETFNRGYPSSTAELYLGQYTLYNFGRDQIVFDQAKLDWNRSKQAFEEAKRAVRFEVIIAFWTLKNVFNKLKVYQKSVDTAEKILKARQTHRRLSTSEDLSSAKVDFNNAKNLRNSTYTDLKNALYSLNVLLGDSVGHRYTISEEVNFLPIKVTEDILYKTYLDESPQMKKAKKELAKSELEVLLAEKNRLPLPVIKFSGATLSYNQGYSSTSPNFYTSGNGHANLDVSAEISLTLPLLGTGGFFGSRTVSMAVVSRDQNEMKLRSTAKKDEQQILEYVQNIRQYEETVKNNRENLSDSLEVLNSYIQQLNSGKKVSRLDIRDALKEARDNEIDLNDSLLSHLKYKTELAAFIGVDFLPRME